MSEQDQQLEEFWDDLLAAMDERRVIPVVGPELLTVRSGAAELPLYGLIAAQLLARYGLKLAADVGSDTQEGAVALRRNHELNDAVCAIVRQGIKRANDLYRPSFELIRTAVEAQAAPPEALRELARIPAFDLFVSTTGDRLLARALGAAGGHAVEEIPYAPNLPGNLAKDIPQLQSERRRAVFYLFGQASASPFYAIHDEDTLEFVYNLQTGRGIRPERMLSELRDRNLLLIGCNFADWLSRFFIRFSNSTRLASSDRTKKEFLVEEQLASDRSLTVFLERFSQNTRIYAGSAQAFVRELSRRWDERYPAPATGLASAPTAPSERLTADVFISYSRTDRAAARQLYQELQEIGLGVAWFDQNAIQPGDSWEDMTRTALKRCAIFLPLLSATTESRVEGYFRKEWFEAAERSKSIQGRRFIVPVVVDSEFDNDASRYKLVPERFNSFQFEHAPGGHMSEPLRNALRATIRELRRQRPQ